MSEFENSVFHNSPFVGLDVGEGEEFEFGQVFEFLRRERLVLSEVYAFYQLSICLFNPGIHPSMDYPGVEGRNKQKCCGIVLKLLCVIYFPQYQEFFTNVLSFNNKKRKRNSCFCVGN